MMTQEQYDNDVIRRNRLIMDLKDGGDESLPYVVSRLITMEYSTSRAIAVADTMKKVALCLHELETTKSLKKAVEKMSLFKVGHYRYFLQDYAQSKGIPLTS